MGCTATLTTAWLWIWPLACDSIPVLPDACQGEGKAHRGSHSVTRPTNKLFGSSGSRGPSSQSHPATAAPSPSLRRSSWGCCSRSLHRTPTPQPSRRAHTCPGETGASPGPARETFPFLTSLEPLAQLANMAPSVVHGRWAQLRRVTPSYARGTESKRCNKQKTQAFFFFFPFSTFPCLFSFSQFLLEENFQPVLKTTKSSQNKLTLPLPAAIRVHFIAPININLSK